MKSALRVPWLGPLPFPVIHTLSFGRRLTSKEQASKDGPRCHDILFFAPKGVCESRELVKIEVRYVIRYTRAHRRIRGDGSYEGLPRSHDVPRTAPLQKHTVVVLEMAFR